MEKIIHFKTVLKSYINVSTIYLNGGSDKVKSRQVCRNIYHIGVINKAEKILESIMLHTEVTSSCKHWHISSAAKSAIRKPPQLQTADYDLKKAC